MATGRRRSRAIIYIALILIVVLVLLIVLARPPMLFGQKAEQTTVSNTAKTIAPTPQDVVDIVVTTQDVSRGQELKDELLALVSVPRKDFTEGVFYTSKQELLGARAKYDLRAHTPLTNALIFSVSATGSVPSFEIPAGKVAISVPISKLSSVAYGLQKGDHVNVIASLLMSDIDANFQSRLPNRTGSVIAPGPISENQTYVTAQLNGPPGYEVAGTGFTVLGRIEIDPTMNNPVYVIPSEQQRPRLVSQTLIQDIVILQLGTFSQPLQPAISRLLPRSPKQLSRLKNRQRLRSAKRRHRPEVAAPLPDVVTLIVSPQDAVTLNYLMLAGANLNMVLRSAGDT